MDKRQCTATSKQSGKRCGKAPVTGALVCATHGGKAPQVQAAAAGRVVEAEARRTFGRLAEHAEPIPDPFVALEQMAGEVWAWKEFCAGRIAELAELGSLDAKGTEQIAAEVALFERAMDRCTATLATIAKLDIDARLARIREKQADVVLRAVDAGIAAAGITDRDTSTRVRSVVARELRSVS